MFTNCAAGGSCSHSTLIVPWAFDFGSRGDGSSHHGLLFEFLGSTEFAFFKLCGLSSSSWIKFLL